MTATDLLPRLTAIGEVLARKAPAIVATLIAFLESIVRALDATYAGGKAERKSPVSAPPGRENTAPGDAGELPEFMRRLLGWSTERRSEVDRALRDVGEMASGRAALILLGKGSMLGVAHRLHRLALPERSFLALGADDSAAEALDQPAHGMLYIDARSLPRELDQLASCFRGPVATIRLVVGAERAEDLAALRPLLSRSAAIQIPPIAERADELDRLIEVYAADAVAELGAPKLGFRPDDVTRIRASGLATLDEIEDVTRRMVALRNWGVAGGAARLGITHGALSRWAKRRRIPT